MDEVLTKGEVAKYLKVSVMTVSRMINRGDLRAIKTGRLVRVRQSDLLAYLDSHLKVKGGQK